jgi:hypothetical protein
MGGDARWLPTRACEDLTALSAVARYAGRVRARTAIDTRICSVSSEAAALRLAERFDEVAQNLPTAVATPLDLVPFQPGRLYEREQVGPYQATLVHHGWTANLSTPVPQNVEADSADGIRWMTDIDVSEWMSIRHPSLSGRVLTQPVTDEMTRCGRDGVSYFCPGPITRVGIGLDYQTVRPKFSPAGLLQQVEYVLAGAGWRAVPSDKGIYMKQSAAIFGGEEQLVAALTDDRALLLTVFLAEGDEAPGWRLTDERRYLTIEELQGLAAEEGDLAPRVIELEEAGALVPGLVLKCERCRGSRFYRLADVGETFQCSRCWLEQTITQERWMVGPEPPWRYGLAEVIYQFLLNNGDLPLLSAYDFVRARAEGRPSAAGHTLQFAGELDVFDLNNDKHETDILVADGSELWVGEATTKARLEDANARELARLQRLRETADVLCARGALLITSGTWNRRTVGRARAAFQGIWPRLEPIDGGRRAKRWSAATDGP